MCHTSWMAPYQTLRDKSEVRDRITHRRSRVYLGSWSHCYRQMLKITQREKQSARRCAYLSSISLSVLFMHPHKHRTDPARLSENIRQKQQQSEFILQSHPRTDAGSALLNVSNQGSDSNIHTCDVTIHHAFSSSIQMNESIRIII